MEVTIPNFVDGVTNDLGCGVLCFFVGCIVTNKDGMFGFLMGLYYCICIVFNSQVR